MESDQPLFRVFGTGYAAAPRSVTSFNPGLGAPSRFAFFHDEAGVVVPALYAAQTENAAVCESLLHDIPLSGGALLPSDYEGRALGSFHTDRPVNLAELRGTGLRQLGVEARDLTDTAPSAYGATVAWAQAAHWSGCDGMAWTSAKCNDAFAVVLFGDRVAEESLHATEVGGRSFLDPRHVDWLAQMCAPMRIKVLR
ncbi:MAG: RES family NAD+ phosphorylase [Galactobacter sp.]